MNIVVLFGHQYNILFKYTWIGIIVGIGNLTKRNFQKIATHDVRLGRSSLILCLSRLLLQIPFSTKFRLLQSDLRSYDNVFYLEQRGTAPIFFSLAGRQLSVDEEGRLRLEDASGKELLTGQARGENQLVGRTPWWNPEDVKENVTFTSCSEASHRLLYREG